MGAAFKYLYIPWAHIFFKMGRVITIAKLGLAAERGPGSAVTGVAAAPSPPWQVLLFVFAAAGFIMAGNTQGFFTVCREIDTVISFLSHK